MELAGSQVSGVIEVLEAVAVDVLGDVLKRLVEEVLGAPDDSAAARIAKVTIAATLAEAEAAIADLFAGRAAAHAVSADKDIAILAESDAKLAASGVLEEPNREGPWVPGFPIK